MTEIVNIAKSGEPRPTSIIDDNIDASKQFHGFFY